MWALAIARDVLTALSQSTEHLSSREVDLESPTIGTPFGL